MKKNILFIFWSLGIFFLLSCGSEKPKIGFLSPNMVDERCQIDQKFFSAKINELGGEPLMAEAKNNDQLQIQQAQELISQGVKALVIMPVNKNTAAVIVRYAHSKGVKVIAYERFISNCDLDYYVTYDNVKVGQIMAEYALSHKPQGKYVIMGGDKSDQNAVWVKEGQMKVLEPYIKSGKIKIVYDSFIEDWSGDNAYQEIKKIMNLDMQMPDAILSAYDGMSQGIVKALNESGIKDFPLLTGQNGELLSCRHIVQGKQSMTIYKSVKVEAEKAAEIAMQCVRKDKINTETTMFNGSKNVPSVLISPVLADASNLKNTIIKDGAYKEEDIYGK